MDPHDFVARLPPAIRDADALFKALKVALRFPSYFGANWAALDECMGDLHQWIDQTRIVLIHDAIPHLTRRELVIYLSILHDAMRAMASDQDHDDRNRSSRRVFTVAFPRNAEQRIQEVWSGVKSDPQS